MKIKLKRMSEIFSSRYTIAIILISVAIIIIFSNNKKLSELLSSPYTYAVLIAIAAFVAAYGSHKIGNTINKTFDETLGVKDTTIAAQKDIIGQLTGGNSYPRISLGKNCFYITVKGSYSIPECQIEIIFIRNYTNTPYDITSDYLNKGIKDGNNFIELYNLTYKKLWKNSKTIKIPYKEIITESIKNDSSIGFDIYFTSTFKRWKQEIRLLKFPDNLEKLGIVDLLTEEKSNSKKGDVMKSREIYIEISDEFPTMFIQEEAKRKFCHINLYNIENQNLQFYQPNFVMEMTAKYAKLPVYNLSDFLIDNK